MSETSVPAPPRRARLLATGLLLAALAAVLVAWGLVSRAKAHAALVAQSRANAVPTVIATHPQAEPAVEEIVLPGQVKGLAETPIFARTNGYVRSWSADIGAHVKAGQLLAVIASPEVDQQLRQAEADLKTAEANAAVARSTAERVAGLVSTQSVSRQEGEDRAAAASATASQVTASQANVARLRQLQGFERITAPFTGVITARSTDVGALINAGGTQGPELFRIADSSRLRTYVDVPQAYAARIHPGVAAALQFPDHPGVSFPAAVTRTASAIDPQARTITVELDIDNRAGVLFPGAFTEVHFELPPPGHGQQLPGNALLFRADGVQVATVGADGRVALKPIVLGRDYGAAIEVLSGVSADDQVILNPSAAIASGDRVRVRLAAPQPAKAAS